VISRVWIDESEFYMPFASSTPTITSTASTTWNTWVGNTIHTTTSTTATRIWTTWSTAATHHDTIVMHHPARPPVRLTPEQTRERAAAIERLRAEQAQRAAVERQVAQEANARAELLLVGMLTAEQRETYSQARFIIVIGRSGRRYRVRRGRVGNIDVIGPNGHIESRLCAHPGIWTPDPDVMLAQLLHLQHDDDAFCRTANVHEVLSNEGRILPPLLQ
jgi:hypothetical protein